MATRAYQVPAVRNKNQRDKREQVSEYSSGRKERQAKNLVELGDSDPRSKRKKVEDLRSYFGRDTGNIIKLLNQNNNDGAVTLLKKRMLQTMVSLLPYAEHRVRESGTERGLYQFSTLVSHIRELVADIQADQDREYLAQGLIDSVIRPAFMEIAQYVVTDHHEFRAATSQLVNPDKQQQFSSMLRELAKQLATKMMETYKDVETKTKTALKG